MEGCMRILLQVVALVFVLLTIRFIYYRYIPAHHVKEMDVQDALKEKSVTVLDIRDFNVSYKDPIKGSVDVPLSYLRRNLHKIANKNVYVITSDFVGKNLAIRILKQNRYGVIGYTIRKDSGYTPTFFTRIRNNKEGVAS